MTLQEQKFKQMTEPPVHKLICKLAIPCIISMLVTSFYNMADTYFVGMMDSTAATGAVGVVFAMMAIIQAVGFFFGHGSGNYISRMLGKQNHQEASVMASTGFFSALATGVLICVVGEFFLEPLAFLLGATNAMLKDTKAYLGVILLGAPWMTASLVLNNQLRYQGSAMYAMVGIVAGAVINIGLDPLLILYFDMGVAGAGWATIISQFISFCILLIGCSKGGNLRLQFGAIRLKWIYFKNIIQGGLPSLARQSLASVAAMCLNHVAGDLGDAAVIAAMTVVQRIMMFGGSAMIGFGQGFQPFCGFNYGARLYDRVKKGFWFCFKSSTGFLALIALAGFIFAPQLISVFRDDPDVIAIGATALRFQWVTFCFHGWIVMSSMMTQTIGLTGPATFLAVARQGLFFIPLVWILSSAFGLPGIQMTQAAADLLTLVVSIPIQITAMRHMTD